MNAHAGFFFFLHQPFYFDEFLSKIEHSCPSPPPPPLPLRTIYLCGGWKPCCFLPSLSLSVSVSLCVLTSPASSGILSVAQPALLNTSGESPRPSLTHRKIQFFFLYVTYFFFLVTYILIFCIFFGLN